MHAQTEKMKSIIVKGLILQCLFLFCVAQDYDVFYLAQDYEFFYFAQEWGPSYCSSRKECCYPNNVRPETNFTIAGLYPSYKDGTLLTNCNKADFCAEKIRDLKKPLQNSWPSLSCPSEDVYRFWSFVFQRYGTCSIAKFSQRRYFEAALRLKNKINVLKALESAGIVPGGVYLLSDVEAAIKKGTGYEAAVDCNKDKDGKPQIYKVLHCTDASASKFIECPAFPKRTCSPIIYFPTYKDELTQPLISQVTEA